MTQVPNRLAILVALTDHLKAITPDNGYEFDLSQSVYRGRNLLGADVRGDNLPLVSILESPRPDIAVYAAEEANWRWDQWTLLIQGLIDDDKRNPSDRAYYLCAAVEQHLARLSEVRRETGKPRYPDEYLLGGRVTGMEIAPPVVRPPEDRVSAAAFFFLPIRVGVAIETSHPYTGGKIHK